MMCELLQSLQQEGLMTQNPISVAGDVIELYIGTDKNADINLVKEVDVSVDSASSATLDERLTTA